VSTPRATARTPSSPELFAGRGAMPALPAAPAVASGEPGTPTVADEAVVILGGRLVRRLANVRGARGWQEAPAALAPPRDKDGDQDEQGYELVRG
jgi:hypothetical protein